MDEKVTAGLYLECEKKNRLRKRLVDMDGTVVLDEVVSPHDELLRLMDWRTDDYHRALTELEQSPLFDEGIEVCEEDFYDVFIDAGMVPDEHLSAFPEARYFAMQALTQVLEIPDDGSAMYLLTSGVAAVKAAQEAYRTKLRVRNMLEVCFGTTEGFTQRERFEKLCAVYPFLRQYSFSSLENGSYPYTANSLFELYAYELMAALRSDKRIARCKNCWQYFVPRTKKKTDYCYRVWQDGQDCGQKGANLKRNDGPAEDKYLAAHERLRERFYQRENREYAHPEERMTVPYQTYWDWGEVARQERAAYVRGEIDGDELLRRINPEGEPVELKDIEREELPVFTSDWKTLVERSIDFDPNREFEGFMFLDLGEPNPSWLIQTPEEQARAAKGEAVSLREKYGEE